MKGGICMICGYDDKITKHHLTEKELNRKGRFRKTGEIIPLCEDCHVAVEMVKVKMRWGKRLQQIKEKAYKEGFKDGIGEKSHEEAGK